MKNYINSIQFEYRKQNIPLQLFDSDEYHFGIVKIQMNKNETIQPKSHIHFVFSVDCSGSMSDLCSDNRTKMQHIKYTMENMIRVFSEKTNCIISMHVNTFDTEVNNIIYNTEVNKDTMYNMIEQINNIYPRDMTNIEVALKTASEDISAYKEDNASIVHILLTDGTPTIGSTDADYLKTLISSEYQNILIGYGKHHDAHFMSELASNPKDVYLFIDALEKAGLVYGEIIHNILYKLIENVTLTTMDCEIYDYKTNTWGHTLYVGEMVSEMEKIYHIRSKMPKCSSIQLEGKILSHHIQEIVLLPTSFEEDLTKYIFRQRTQELLYETKVFSKHTLKPRNNIKPKLLPHKRNNFLTESIEELALYVPQNKPEPEIKTKLYEHFQRMTEYIKEHHLENDKFLKMLCDDMFINYEMIGKEELGLYSCARQTSQGRQTSYTPSSNIFSPNYRVSNSIDDSPYSTQGVIETMNIISGDIFDSL